MASLKSKRKTQAKIARLDEKIEYLNEDERQVLEEQLERDMEDLKRVSTERMEKAIKVVSDKFNLIDSNFSLTGFSDKGNKCQVALTNEDFDITVLVKDTEKFEII